MTPDMILNTVTKAREILEAALNGPMVSPPWSHPNQKDQLDWVYYNAETSAQVKKDLRKVEEVLKDNPDVRHILPYVTATLQSDGYFHAGRAGSAVCQLKMLIKHLTK